ncbi:hypothetical protein [Bosea sp. LjRoot237]|uniref:hypothetical protein n=1 Tax=Bosea sp. LjRoot237 TaxID=3342292 RepID=UPI003ED13A38
MKLEDTLPEALATTLGQIIGDLRKQWLTELELLRAERRALVSELRLAALGVATPAPAAEPTMPAPGAKARPPAAKPAKIGSRS